VLNQHPRTDDYHVLHKITLSVCTGALLLLAFVTYQFGILRDNMRSTNTLTREALNRMTSETATAADQDLVAEWTDSRGILHRVVTRKVEGETPAAFDARHAAAVEIRWAATHQ